MSVYFCFTIFLPYSVSNFLPDGEKFIIFAFLRFFIFEKALRNCLDLGGAYAQCNDRVWNYDLITNKKNTEEALKGKKPIPKFILGPPKDDKGKIPVPSKDRGKKPGDGKEGEESPGTPGPRKRP